MSGMECVISYSVDILFWMWKGFKDKRRRWDFALHGLVDDLVRGAIDVSR